MKIEPETPYALGSLVGGITVHAMPLKHRVPTWGYLLTEPDKPYIHSYLSSHHPWTATLIECWWYACMID
jgi:hypothetical protein